GIAEKLGECGVETDNDKTAEQVYTDIDFGPEDNLSRLPDLCLFQILLLLSRNDLDNLKKVSRKMGAIVEEPELRKIKSGGGHLCIFRLPRGHGFELEMGKIKLAENDDREVNSDVVFVYEAEFVKGKGYKHGITERRTTTTISRVEARLHRSPCPKSMFDILEKLLNTRTVDVVRLHSVGLDASLLEGLVSSTMGQSLKELHVLNCKVNATHEDFEKFTNWIKTTRTKKLTVKNTCGLVRSSFLNENFFIEMNGQMTSIDIEASFVQYSKARFHPLRDIIPHLSHFSILNVPSMVVAAEWLGELLMTRLRSAIASYDAGSW
ncbi:hypothetical protein PFISCL1PPCAC_648, partial [Pristionchus fissidentatus]